MPQPLALTESVLSDLSSLSSIPICREQRIEDRLHHILPSTETHPQPLHQAMHHAVFSGGKRLRPQLLLQIAGACGADSRELELALTIGCAVELIHTASLVHDDLPCFDNADTRRGRPTVHVQFGTPMAVLVGDALIALAFESLTEAPPQLAGRALRAVRLLARATGSAAGIIGGQSMEQSLAPGAHSSSPELMDRYHQMKTAALFQLAGEAGAVVAGSARAAEWAWVGQLIGRWYQLADDFLDTHAQSALVGKPVGQDAAHGRPNAILHLGPNVIRARMRGLLREIESRVLELCAEAATSPAPVLSCLEAACDQLMQAMGGGHAST